MAGDAASMRVLIFGATGTAGSGLLRSSLDAATVTEVRVIARRAPAVTHPKLRVFLHDDYLDYSGIAGAFSGVDACLFALGISISQVSGEAEYRKITHDFALAAARQLKKSSPSATFHFISGQGTRIDSRMLWARVKGETERDLIQTAGAVCWRPAFIDGSVPTGPRLYRSLRPLFRLLRSFRGLYVKGEDIGRAMLQATSEGVRGRVIENREIRDIADRATV